MPVRKAMGVRRYLAQRILQTVLVWFLIATINFFIFRIMPGDPRAALLKPGMDPDIVQYVTARFGLDQPLAVQFVLYIVNIFRIDFGYSFSNFSEPVLVTIFGQAGGLSRF